jgi:hypothetical protein
VDTAQIVPFPTAARNAKAPLQFLLMLLIMIFHVGRLSPGD